MLLTGPNLDRVVNAADYLLSRRVAKGYGTGCVVTDNVTKRASLGRPYRVGGKFNRGSYVMLLHLPRSKVGALHKLTHSLGFKEHSSHVRVQVDSLLKPDDYIHDWTNRWGVRSMVKNVFNLEVK